MSRNILKIPQGSATSTSLTTIQTTPRICLRCSFRLNTHQPRSFTSSRSRNGVMGDTSMANKPKTPNQLSMKSRVAQLGKKAYGNDLGRLPGAIIRPPWADYPSGVKAIATLHWRKFVDSMTGLFSILYATKWDVAKDPRTDRSKRLPAYLQERTKVAMEFHQVFNYSLAGGHLAQLHKICSSGLYDKCKQRIERKNNKNIAESWALVRYRGIDYPSFLLMWPISFFLPGASARVVSDKMAAIPYKERSYIRECIVRIKSLQSLNVKTDSGTKNTTAALTEYVVMQKFIFEGVEEDWRIWGTVDLSKDEIDTMLSKGNKLKKQGVTEIFKSRLSSITGLGI